MIFIVLFCSGCIVPQKYSFRLDYKKQEAELIYYDLNSDATSDSGAQEDWDKLKELVSGDFPNKDYKQSFIPIKQELFLERGVLSGKMLVKIKCPECFSSKAELLQELNTTGTFKSDNKQIIVNFVTEDKLTLSGNGKKLTPTSMAWPENQEMFIFQVKSEKKTGRSLLPFYSKEFKNK